jgi:hypothetical protein
MRFTEKECQLRPEVDEGESTGGKAKRSADCQVSGTLRSKI